MSAFPKSHRDLLDGRVASLTTLDSHGAPQSSIVWFLYDEDADAIKISLSTRRLKTRQLLKRPQISLMVSDPANEFRYVDVRGTASTEPDPGYAFADVVGAKYGANLRDFDAEGGERIVVTITDPKVYAVDMSA